jgi:hypothetical protein
VQPLQPIAAPISLPRALLAIARHPIQALLGNWNWKVALISAILRAIMFFCTNIGAGRHHALRAMLVEAVYATFAAGILGAVTERLRNACPQGLTNLIVWLALPTLMLVIQFFVHRFFATPRLRTSMIASFIFAALATGFNLFAQRRGAMIVGEGRTTILHDLRAIPRLLADFLLAAPRALVSALGSERSQ